MAQSDLPIYILAYIIAFIAAIFITRAIFSIPKFLKLQEAQLHILTEIAKQQGVKDEVIVFIHGNCGVNRRPQTNEEMRDDLEKFRTENDLK